MAADRTLLEGKTGLEQAKKALVTYKMGQVQEMTPELWKAKKVVDSTLHPGTRDSLFAARDAGSTGLPTIIHRHR